MSDTKRIELIARVEKLLGAKVESVQPAEGGYTPALRLCCRTASASFFVKAGTTPLTNQFLQREIRMYRQLHGGFMPRLVAWEDNDLQPILIIEDLSSHTWPPPWDERMLELVLAQIEALHHTPAAIDTFAEVFGDLGGNWHTVADDPMPFLSLGLTSSAWLENALPSLVRYASRCPTEGSSLGHWDLRSDNICIGSQNAKFVDWNMACLGNPTLDLGFFLPSLAAEGGPPPERILPEAPEVAAKVSGYFAARAGQPGIPDAPRVRRVQRQQLETALPWVIRALDLPPLDSVS
jgi:thiamine kinase-like enzyme